MAYFDGGIHGYNDSAGYHPPAKVTTVYCDECAETSIPLPAHGPRGDRVGRHWSTAFSWAPHYGSACHVCKRAA